MSDDRLIPEERAVIEAALAWGRFHSATTGFHGPNAELYRAVDAYREAAAPPEPFERWFVRLSGHTWDDIAYPDAERAAEGIITSHVWRCTVTPVERVR